MDGLKSLIVLLVVLITSCGYSEDLHVGHHQLGLLWNYRFHDL